MNTYIRKIFLTVVFLAIFVVASAPVHAQGMMGRFNNTVTSDSQSSTAQDEAAGKIIFDKLQSRQVTCQALTDDDFDVLGDYYMGQRLGSSAAHAQMNDRMTQMMGADGEKQMHIALGKRQSGCDTLANFPSQGSNFLPMMGFAGGMMGGRSNNWNNGFGFGGISMIGFWILIALATFGLVKLIAMFVPKTPKKK